MRSSILQRMASRRIGHARGFTLVELLVAITILAIIAVLGWRGLDSIVRARASLTAEMEQTRGIQLAFAQIENDCAHLVDPASLPGREVLNAVGTRLVMIRNVFEENQPTRLQVVVYRVANGVLSRREMLATRELANLDSDWQSAMSDADASPAIDLQSMITGFDMRTWKDGENGWRTGGSEAGSTPVQAAPGVPSQTGKLNGLEIAIQISGRELPVTKVFLLGAV
ncbi:prepilin-type N-terminal cleavage/methylation domain-containing protein [Undibacterium sp. TS12]|uniref:PulJ/GspJ family protein n=1 Tax=Undibacterium sp. TS12 TaxID=2908202 RepID=UPI001F4CF5DE|nr:prepilin-type N-terminal cleavage/methylation domain-containing protein [Undibacterium sp. TS12]MCH8618853.1 prepilin-type N-terminal cleavage/methylation domain-containing protein [Undibacterium sp. TS12]